MQIPTWGESPSSSYVPGFIEALPNSHLWTLTDRFGQENDHDTIFDCLQVNQTIKKMELELLRTYFERGTNGVIKCTTNKTFICFSIELPWNNNLAERSCIPEGKYSIVMRFSRRHGLHFILQRVKGRSLILIHPANHALRELRGCIAPVTLLTGEGTGSSSVKAFNKLKKRIMEAMDNNEPVFITIKSNNHDD